MMTRNAVRRAGISACIAGVAIATGASAQPLQSAFEPPVNGSTSGHSLIGQAGFYDPSPSNSTDWMVYRYSGNNLGMPANPGGDAQFVAGRGQGGGTRARAQIDYDFTDGRWRIASDVAVGFSGALPASNPIGSLSTEPWQVTGAVNLIAHWTNPATASTWELAVGYFDSGNEWTVEEVPGAGFSGLATKRWYRWWADVNYDTNEIELVGIRDLASGQSSTYEPSGWYLGGGSGGAPRPTGVRFVAGATETPGNVLAFDNVEAIPETMRVALTQSADPETIEIGNSIACVTPEPPSRTFAASFYRSFDLSQNPAIFGDYLVESVELGVEVAVHPQGRQDVTVRLHEDVNGGLPRLTDLRPIASATASVTNQQETVITIPISGRVPNDATLVVEVFTPDYSALTEPATFFVGSNSAGQSGATYWRTTGCGFSQIIDVADPLVGGGFPDMHMVMTVHGVVDQGDCYADCDPTQPGVLDIFDFLCFQDAFVTGDPYACDCDQAGGAGVCNIFDFLCFQDAFVAGCP